MYVTINIKKDRVVGLIITTLSLSSILRYVQKL